MSDADADALTHAIRRYVERDGPVIDDGIDALRATLLHIIDTTDVDVGGADIRPTKRDGGNMAHNDDGRDAAGRFTRGNPGGPGRPRRAVETDYLRALTERVTPDVWGDIIDNVVNAARGGDMRAVAFLARYLHGATPPTLFSLAVADAAGADVDAEIAHVVERVRDDDTRYTRPNPVVAQLGPNIGRPHET